MISKPVLVTAPATTPITLAEAKTFLRVDASDEDALISAQISAATRRLEALTDKKFVSQTWDVFFDSLPCKSKDDWWDGTREGALSELYAPNKFLDLPFGPLISVTGVYTYDEDDTEYEFASSNYSIDTAGPFGRIALKIGATWPSTILRPVNGLRVRGVFGYSNLPDDIKEAVKQFTAKIYEHRGDELPQIPASVSMLLEPYRKLKLGY